MLQALSLTGFAALCPGQGAISKTASQPNILFIMVDDLGKDWVGYEGAENIKTPAIDKLAAGGMRLTNVWSMPQCTPTRVTLLTGQYPWRSGWVNHWDVPRWGIGYFDWRHYTSFANVMKSAGYKTAIAGKWQINDFRIEPKALEKHGFDDWCVWTGYEAGNRASGKRYWDPYIHTRTGSKTYQDKFGPDIYCDFLIDFMRRHRRDPMMLYFPMALTHGPLVHTPLRKDAKGKTERHTAMVEYTDHLVGRLTKAIEDLGLSANTIVIFTTDNGTSRGLLGTRDGKRPSGGKASKWEGGVCQPFVVYGPGRVPPRTTRDALVDFSDLLPTFAELGGAALPKDAAIDGRSFAKVLLGQADDGPRQWIMSLGHGAARLDELGVVGKLPYTPRVIRDKRYKVWVDQGRQITALYDLRDDPLERTNLMATRPAGLGPTLEKMRGVIASTPKLDARPRYQKRAARPWDRKPRK
ncbi:MAG: sulfatase-like hydrolase/transferase [Planctomycetota bacterium]|nr:sulfatase-like hydrolase/transferase [Planctomycetota bacterium]